MKGGGVMKGVGVGGVCSIIPGMYATCQSKCVITHTINHVLCQVKATACAGGRGGGGWGLQYIRYVCHLSFKACQLSLLIVILSTIEYIIPFTS